MPTLVAVVLGEGRAEAEDDGCRVSTLTNAALENNIENNIETWPCLYFVPRHVQISAAARGINERNYPEAIIEAPDPIADQCVSGDVMFPTRSKDTVRVRE